MSYKPTIRLNITERDLGLGFILREAAKLRKKPFIKVGVTQKKGSKLHIEEDENGKAKLATRSVADIAQIHEYGAPKAHIPERSFIRSTVEKNRPKYNAHLEALKDLIFDGTGKTTTERAMGIFGQEVASDIKATIRAKIPPPLKNATIRNKNASVIGPAKARLDAGGSAKDFTAAGSRRNDKDEALVSTGGESTPLINTGQLINSISYEVVLEGEGKAS